MEQDCFSNEVFMSLYSNPTMEVDLARANRPLAIVYSLML